jgi:hypothetical protein
MRRRRLTDPLRLRMGEENAAGIGDSDAEDGGRVNHAVPQDGGHAGIRADGLKRIGPVHPGQIAELALHRSGHELRLDLRLAGRRVDRASDLEGAGNQDENQSEQQEGENLPCHPAQAHHGRSAGSASVSSYLCRRV